MVDQEKATLRARRRMCRSIAWGIVAVMLLCVVSLILPIRVGSDRPVGMYVLRTVTWPGYAILETLFPGEWPEGTGITFFVISVVLSGSLYGFVWEFARRRFYQGR
jgi:hypothetical protein